HALQRVMPSQVQVMPKHRLLGAVGRRLADKYRRTQNRRKNRVAKGCGRPVDAPVGFELGVTDLTDFERALAFRDIEDDWCALDRDARGDHLEKTSERPAELPNKDVEDRLLLRSSSALVYIESCAKFPCKTFPGMWPTMASARPATSTPLIVPLSKW